MSDDSPGEKEQAFDWFVEGFKAAGEGYNGEYPFSFDDNAIRDSIRDEFEEEWSDE